MSAPSVAYDDLSYNLSDRYTDDGESLPGMRLSQDSDSDGDLGQQPPIDQGSDGGSEPLSGEDSYHSAAEENIPPSDDGEDDIEPLSRQQISEWIRAAAGVEERFARRILIVLRHGLISCHPDVHDEARRDHEHGQKTHNSLRRTYSPRNMDCSRRTRAETSTRMGIRRGEGQEAVDPSLSQAPRHDFPPAARLRHKFTGITGVAKEDRICLHTETDTVARLAINRYDVDSAISVFSDLAEVRSTVHYCPVPQPSRRLAKSIHVSVTVATAEGLVKKVKIHHIPHVLFGTVGNYPLYIFFPNLYRLSDGAEPAYLTHKQYQVLYDSVMLPALSELGNDLRQHLPVSYVHAVAASRSRVAEISGRASGRGAPLDIAIAYQYLPSLWRHMRQTLASRQDFVRDFDRPFFCYNSANHKLEFREDMSINATLSRFWSDYQRRVNRLRQGEDQQYIDLAAEVLPHENEYSSKSVALPRRCCQHNTLRFLLGNDEEALGARLVDDVDTPAPVDVPHRPYKPKRATTVEYNHFGLRDTISLTCEPLLSSEFFHMGLGYFQSYSITEETFREKGVQPFSNPGLVNLAYGEQQWEALAAAAKIDSSRKHLNKSLQASIHRVNEVLAPGRAITFGHRIEFRITPALADLVRTAEASYCAALLVANGKQAVVRPRSSPPSPYNVSSVFDFDDTDQVADTWTIPDANSFFFVNAIRFNHFLSENIDKHLIVIDSIQAMFIGSSKTSCTPPRVATLFALVILSLRHFISHLPLAIRWMVDAPLAADQMADNSSQATVSRAGIGMRKIMEDRGFAFWPDIVDWDKFELSPGIEERLTIPNFQRRRNYAAVRRLGSLETLMDDVLKEYEVEGLGDTQSIFLLEVTVHLLLIAYRQVVVSKLFPAAALREEPGLGYLERDTLRFTYQDLSAAIDRHAHQQCHLVTGNRSKGLGTATLFQFLWGYEHVGTSRDRIKSLSFRYLLDRARDAPRDPNNDFLSFRKLERVLFHRFFQQHTCVPYPDCGGSLTATSWDGTRSRSLCAWEYRPPTSNFDLCKRLEPDDIVVMFKGQKYSAVKSSRVPFPIPDFVAKVIDIEDVRAGLKRPINLLWSRKRKAPL